MTICARWDRVLSTNRTRVSKWVRVFFCTLCLVGKKSWLRYSFSIYLGLRGLTVRLITKIRNAAVVFACAVCLTIATAHAAEHPVTKADVEHAANAGDFQKAYELLVRLADSGHAQAQGFLAYVLYEGEWGVAKDWGRAEKYFVSAAASGDGMAHLFLYLMNLPDVEYAPDDWHIKSDDYQTNLEISLKTGNAAAQHFYASQLRNEKEYAKSYAYFVKSADQGFLLSKTMQVFIEDYEHHKTIRSADRIKSVATTGVPIVIVALAGMYKHGVGVPRSYSLAYEFLLLANEFADGELGPGLDEKLATLSKPLSDDQKKRIQKRISEAPFVWAEGPNTYLAPAAKWCQTSGNWTKSCIINAFRDHEFCLIPYLYWKFERPAQFPAYQACRAAE